jgi:hypothetical protein
MGTLWVKPAITRISLAWERLESQVPAESKIAAFPCVYCMEHFLFVKTCGRYHFHGLNRRDQSDFLVYLKFIGLFCVGAEYRELKKRLIMHI